jgi:tetratricopeptide (TPR) repeat protein
MRVDLRRAGVVLLAVLLLSGSARADKAADHALELKARENFAAGRYAEALDIFAKLYAETLHPVYLRNIGRCQQGLRQPQKAIDAFRDYLAKEKKISADERAEIEGYIKEMEALRDEQARQAQAPVVPIAPATPPAAPGPPPTGYAPPAGPEPTSTASASLVAQPAPAPGSESTPVYKKWWFWTLVGAAVAGGVIAAVVINSGTIKPPCPTSTSCGGG